MKERDNRKGKLSWFIIYCLTMWHMIQWSETEGAQAKRICRVDKKTVSYLRYLAGSGISIYWPSQCTSHHAGRDYCGIHWSDSHNGNQCSQLHICRWSWQCHLRMCHGDRDLVSSHQCSFHTKAPQNLCGENSISVVQNDMCINSEKGPLFILQKIEIHWSIIYQSLIFQI